MTLLRQRMLDDMRIRNFALATQDQYIISVNAYAKYFNQSPDKLQPEYIRTYQLYLLEKKKLSPASLNVTVSALRFLYRVTLQRDWDIEIIPYAKRPRKLPIVLSPEEMTQFFHAVRNLKYRTVLMTMYAAGLRVSEVTRLKLTDIDSHRMCIRVEQGKGTQGPVCDPIEETPDPFAGILAGLSTPPLAVYQQPEKWISSHFHRSSSLQKKLAKNLALRKWSRPIP